MKTIVLFIADSGSVVILGRLRNSGLLSLDSNTLTLTVTVAELTESLACTIIVYVLLSVS